MNAKVRTVLLGSLFVAAAVFALVVVAADRGQATTDAVAADSCCFTNPRFSGVCEVTPGPEETCASILAYLNNPNSSGRAYCGGTTVRGGWSQVACE